MSEIGIVIPTYNGSSHIVDTVASVIAQTFCEWNLVVVDDGSTDGTAELVTKVFADDPRIRLVIRENGGVACARNTGLSELIDCRYLAFLDHDDVWCPDTLEYLHTRLASNPQLVAAYGLARFIDQSGRPMLVDEAESGLRARWGIADGRAVSWPRDAPTTFPVLAYGNCIWTPGQALIRADPLRIIGGFDPLAAPADDYDMWLRLSLIGDIAFADHLVVGFRKHPGNQSQRNANAVSHGSSYVRAKVYNSSAISAHDRDILVVALRISSRRLIGSRVRWSVQDLAHGRIIRAMKHLRHAAIGAIRYLSMRKRSNSSLFSRGSAAHPI